MGMYFPKLSQTHVWIETDQNGGGFSCPMLPVGKLGELNACSEALTSAKSVEDVENARKKMIELAKTALPEEYHPALSRFDIPALAKLLAYLMYGDDDDQQPKKN